ncbi:Peptidase family M48 [Rubritalea squalenifaciens DSM 18772]|uniref:Peptidase family M48 n=1 Tax=Rubritalea squalenifaciens DSM 18772 TaxID=1123071 RepID=A0A1M6J319_9BACT|nr:M48 family metallopeptidase [Rubritalea squalenifaciens]SHJ41067.1 Peptidase family M48 [Rubritalea squalenifaciens DSM 18772]
MKYWLASISLTTITLLSSCVPTSPAMDQHGHVHVEQSSSSLRARGLKEFEDIKRVKRISLDPKLNQQVQRVAARLKPVIPLQNAAWEFVIFVDDEPNAFALPGGKVGIHTGLFKITQNDAGLAAVLGHEISHVTSNHAGKRQRQTLGLAAGGLLLDQMLKGQGSSDEDRVRAAALYGAGATVGVALPHSRRHELEADRIGAIFMARAGYDPKEAVAMWERFAAYNKKKGSRTPEFLRTHPLDDTRINALKAFMPQALQEYRNH